MAITTTKIFHEFTALPEKGAREEGEGAICSLHFMGTWCSLPDKKCDLFMELTQPFCISHLLCDFILYRPNYYRHNILYLMRF